MGRWIKFDACMPIQTDCVDGAIEIVMQWKGHKFTPHRPVSKNILEEDTVQNSSLFALDGNVTEMPKM